MWSSLLLFFHALPFGSCLKCFHLPKVMGTVSLMLCAEVTVLPFSSYLQPLGSPLVRVFILIVLSLTRLGFIYSSWLSCLEELSFPTEWVLSVLQAWNAVGMGRELQALEAEPTTQNHMVRPIFIMFPMLIKSFDILKLSITRMHLTPQKTKS